MTNSENRVASKARNEMYFASGNLGQEALLDLFVKTYSVIPGFGEHTGEKFQSFLSQPLAFCKQAIEFAVMQDLFNRRDTEEAVFFHLLKNIVPFWENSSERATIRRAELGKFDRAAFLGGITESPWKAMADKISGQSKLQTYARNMLPSGFNWIDVDWHFPDGIIADVLNVSRQAVSYRRSRLTEDGLRKPVDCERADVTNRHLRLLFCMAVAERTGIPVETVDALNSIPIESAREALSLLPDVTANEQERIRETLLHSDDDIPKTGEYTTIQKLRIEKNMGYGEIIRLLLTAFPNALDMSDATLEASAGLPFGIVSALREQCGGWAQTFASIPNVREPRPDLDPILGLMDSKGVTREEAARLLYVGKGKMAGGQPAIPENAAAIENGEESQVQ